jgi:glutaredoxin-like YruB-family protein
MMIKIYTTQSCTYCKVAKEFFKKNNLEFTEVNVVQDQQTLDDFVAKTGQKGVPVIEIGEERTIGFDPDWIKRKLHLIPDVGVYDPAEDNLCDSCQ